MTIYAFDWFEGFIVSKNKIFLVWWLQTIINLFLSNQIKIYKTTDASSDTDIKTPVSIYCWHLRFRTIVVFIS